MIAKTVRLKTLLKPGPAWVALTLALALHVLDEAVHDFLALYNPTVEEIRRRVPFLMLPTFTFRSWITGLALGIGVLLALSPFAFRRARWLRPIALVLAVFMVLNGCLHVIGSLVMGRLIAGTLSAPFLVAAALSLWVAAHREWSTGTGT